MIFALGAVDDLRALPAPVKLAGQSSPRGSSSSRVKMQYLLLPGSTLAMGDDVSVLVTVLWIVAISTRSISWTGWTGRRGHRRDRRGLVLVYTYQLNQTCRALPPRPPHLHGGSGREPRLPATQLPSRTIFMGDSGSMPSGCPGGRDGRRDRCAAGAPATSDVFSPTSRC